MDTSVVHCRLMLRAEHVTGDHIKYSKNGHISSALPLNVKSKACNWRSYKIQ